MPPFSAQRTLMAAGVKAVIPTFSFTARTLSGVGGNIGVMEVNPAGIWQVLAYNNNSGGDGGSWSSPDGDTWTHRSTTVNDDFFPLGICWDPIENRFVGSYGGNSVSNRTVISVGEGNWSSLGSLLSGEQITGLVHDGSQIIALSNKSDSTIDGMSSPDGDPWTVRNQIISTSNSFPGNSDYNHAGGIYTGCHTRSSGGDLSEVISTTPDGVTFTVRDTPLDFGLFAVVYNIYTNTWCATGLTHSSPARVKIITATDPTGTWTDRSPLYPGVASANDGLRDIAAFPGGFIAVGIDSTSKATVFTSFDNGVTWGEETDYDNFNVADRRFDAVAYYPGSGKICIAGGDSAFFTTQHLESN